MRVERNINARLRKLSGRKKIVRLLIFLFVAACPGAIFNYQQHKWSQLGDYQYLIPSPTLQYNIEEHESSHYAKFGEVPDEMLGLIPTSIKILPINGTWENVSWMRKSSELHGNKCKMICHLFGTGNNRMTPVHSSQPLSENSSPYRVLARPISLIGKKKDPRYNRTNGVGNEFLAYSVARELGIYKIPAQTIIASDPSPMNVQSLLRGVHLTFMDDWTNCIPNTTTAHHSLSMKPSSLGINDKELVVDIGKGQNNKMIRLNFVHTNTQAVWKLCLRRNATHYNRVWGQYCLQHEPSMRKCHQQEIAQLLDMALFDAIIFNRDRMVMGSLSNNIHWLWPPPTLPNGETPSLTTDKPLQLVWIDHDHDTFTEKWETKPGKRGDMMKFFLRYCVFPGRLLQRLFHRDDRHRHLSVRVHERLMPKVWATFNGTEGRVMTEERVRTVAQKLQVVDKQVEHLRMVVAKCARRHNSKGVVDVMEFSDI